MSVRYGVFGPPGTGKTTYLSREIQRTAEKYGGHRVIATSFTKAAARELTSRGLPLPEENVGTLHALCYRALGRPKLVDGDAAALGEWNEWCARRGLGFSLSGAKAVGAVDQPGWEVAQSQGSTAADKTRLSVDRLRAQRAPTDRWGDQEVAFHTAWTEWKREAGLVDFTDLLEQAIEVGASPGHDIAVAYCDEVQDWSRLEFELVLSWTDRFEVGAMFVGDPDQCQPARTMVDVEGGVCPIEKLDPNVHRLVTWDRSAGVLVGRRRGVGFRISSRSARLALTELSTPSGRRTRCTSTHRWVARWDRAFVESKPLVTYLMRRGDRWRVGWCQLFNAEGTLHLGIRARMERADEIWILEVHSDRTSASVAESVVASTYGLPTVTFEPVSVAQHMTADAIERTFSGIDRRLSEKGETLSSRAIDCLEAHGRVVSAPFLRRSDSRTRRTIFEVATCNLLPGVMLIPERIDDTRDTRWTLFDLKKEDARYQEVWSLDVDSPSKTYVADGIVTHNSIFSFKGASASTMYEIGIEPGNFRTLRQSYRLPRAVHARAVEWIRRSVGRADVPFDARDSEGSVRVAPSIRSQSGESIAQLAVELAERHGDCMVLATCSYQLRQTIAALRDAGVPFHNPYRVENGEWNSMRGGRERVLAFLRPATRATWDDVAGRLWNAREVWQWLELLPSRGVLRHGAKALVERVAKETERANAVDEPWTWDQVGSLFESAEVAASLRAAMEGDAPWRWLVDHASGGKAQMQSFQYAARVCERRGSVALQVEPRVIVGTMHSVKGGQAGGVILLPDLSPQGQAEWLGSPERRDSVRRVFYVGMTRAREELVLAGCGGNYAVDWGS